MLHRITARSAHRRSGGVDVLVQALEEEAADRLTATLADPAWSRRGLTSKRRAAAADAAAALATLLWPGERDASTPATAVEAFRIAEPVARQRGVPVLLARLLKAHGAPEAAEALWACARHEGSLREATLATPVLGELTQLLEDPQSHERARRAALGACAAARADFRVRAMLLAERSTTTIAALVAYCKDATSDPSAAHDAAAVLSWLNYAEQEADAASLARRKPGADNLVSALTRAGAFGPLRAPLAAEATRVRDRALMIRTPRDLAKHADAGAADAKDCKR